MSAEEFEQRYNCMPEVKKAELIEGIVYMPSPVSIDDHGDPHSMMITWMGVYRAFTPGVQAADNATVRLDRRNQPQPDGLLRILPQFGGQSRTEDKYLAGGPELAGEVAASSVSIDLHEKMRAYQRNNVQEYIIWRTYDEAIDWFMLRGERYKRLPASKDGIYRSKVFPGLWLEAAAMIEGNLARVLEVLHEGLKSPEHATFVAKLAEQCETE